MLCLAPIVALASLGAPSVGMEPLPWRVAEEAVLDRGAVGMGDATVVFAGDGAPRVALSTFGNAQPAMRLAVRGPDGGWRVVPIPAGVVGSGSPDISLAWPEGPGGPWRRAVLEGAGFTPAEAIDLPNGVRAWVADPTEPVRVLSEGSGAATLLLTRTPRGAWKRTRVASGSPPVVRTSARGAWVFTLEGTTVLGRALTGSGRLRARDAITFEAALDPRGRPAVATRGVRAPTITLVDGARRATLRLPPDVHAAPEACLDVPCEVVAHTAELDAVVATARGAAALYTQATTTGAQTCRPFDGPWHPCDPAGPRNTCPKRPEYSCSAKEAIARDPRVAWLARGALRHASLAPLLGWSQADLRSSDAWQVMGAVLGAAADPQGNLHLVVREPASRGAAVRWLRLVPADTPVGERTVAEVAPWSSAFDVVPTSEDALAFAGVVRQQWGGAVRFGPEGAEASGGQWSAALDGLDPEQAAQATVELTFPAAPDPSSPVCGAPAIQLFHQGRGAALYLEAGGMTLVDRYAQGTQRISVPLAGRHRLALRVGRAAAEVRVDGASVGSVTFSGPARSVANERLWVGHTSLCATPGPPLVWHRLAVQTVSAAPRSAP